MWAEETRRANSAPDQGRSGEHIAGRAAESILLVRCADVDNVCKHPVLYRGHDDAADYSSDNLDSKHGAGWDLHVMAKLQITRKTNRLVCANISDRLEDDIGNRATRKDVARDKFGHDLEGDLLVGDCLKHGKWDG